MSEALLRAAEGWAAWMAPMAAQSAALLAALLLAERAAARRGLPHLRVALLTVGLVKLVVPPWVASPASVAALLPADAPAAGGAAGPPSATLLAAFGVWLAGAVAIAAAARLRVSRARRSLLAGALPAPERVASAARRAARRLGLNRVPRVVLAPRAPGALTLGTWAPVVVLPLGAAAEWPRRELGHVLLHELGHVRRGDLLRLALASALQVLYWPNPLVWLLRRRLVAAQELGCDATVTRVLRGRGSGYHRTLLAAAARHHLAPVPAGGLAMASSGREILERLRWLERGGGRGEPSGRASALVVGVALVGCVVPMARRGPETWSAPEVRAAAQAVFDDAAAGGRPGCLRLRHAALALTPDDEEGSR